MKKRFFSKKSRIICFSWSAVGIILICCIYIASTLNDSSMQEIIKNIVICYISASCVLSGFLAYLAKKEKKKKQDGSKIDQ